MEQYTTNMNQESEISETTEGNFQEQHVIELDNSENISNSKKKKSLVVIVFILAFILLGGLIINHSVNKAVFGQHFWGSCYQGSDKSSLYFDKDGSFHWYRDEDASDDCRYGHYSVYIGEDGIKKIPDSLGVSRDIFDIYFKSDESAKDSLTLLYMTTESVIIDGRETINESYTTIYFGFSDKKKFEGVNMNTYDTVSFHVIK